MPRLARRIIPGFAYHLTHRGNNKQQLFFGNEDYQKYLYWFEEVREKYQMEVIAFCLMPNHVHIVAIAAEEHSFARVINVLHTKYALYFNEKFHRCGHVWQGRYYSCLLDQAHLLAAVRYVERNPVRSYMSSKPWDWVWSSARNHVYDEKGIIKLDHRSLLSEINSWREYIDTYDNERDLMAIRSATNSGLVWGEEDFINDIATKYGVSLLKKKPGRPKSVDVPNFGCGASR